jgi:hypothetical protein
LQTLSQNEKKRKAFSAKKEKSNLFFLFCVIKCSVIKKKFEVTEVKEEREGEEMEAKEEREADAC